MVLNWSLSDNRFPQFSRTLLSILTDLSNVVVWTVSTRPLIPKSSCPFTNPLVTVPRAPITLSIIVSFMFHCFFNSLARSRYLYFFSVSFNFSLWSAGTAKFTILQVLFFFYYKAWSCERDWVIRLYVKIPEEFVRVILQGRCWVVHIPFVCTVKFQFLAQFPVDHPDRPVLYSFCANLFHSLIM